MTRATTQPDHRLTFTDQAMFLALRATGAEALIQCVWIYEHPVDYDGLRKFHDNFGYGLAGRLIERSPVPFGRHRWVSVTGPQRGLDIAAPRPRAELGDWLDERAALPMDPEQGPGWHLGVQPFTDGSTAVTLVGSHCLGDGSAGALAVLEAVNNAKVDYGFPRPKSRRRRRAVATDLRETVRELPELGRTLVATAKLARNKRDDITRSSAASPPAMTGPDERIFVPTVTVFVKIADWDTRTKALGGNSYSLVAGFAAKIAEKMGRRRAEDGAVTLNVPQMDRTLGDTRANAVKLANVTIDPTTVTTDLSGVRAALKQGLAIARDEPDEMLQLLPLTPWIPKRAVRKMADVLFGFSADLPVSCSNMGDLPAEIAHADGSAAEYVVFRGLDRYVTRHSLEHRGGLLTVVAARLNGTISISVNAYRTDADNSKELLRDLVTDALADFQLTGVVE